MSRSFRAIPRNIQDQCSESLCFKADGRLYMFRHQQLFIGRGLLTSERTGYTVADVEDLLIRWPQDEAYYKQRLGRLDVHTFFGPAALLDPYKNAIISDVYEEIARAGSQKRKFWDYLMDHEDRLRNPNFYIIDGALFDPNGNELRWDTELPTSSGVVSPTVENQDLLRHLQQAQNSLQQLTLSPASSRREAPRNTRNPSPEEGPSRRASQYDSPLARSSTPRAPPARQLSSRRGDDDDDGDQPPRQTSGGSSYRAQNSPADSSSRRTPVRVTGIRRSEPRHTDYEDEYPPPTPRSARTPPSSTRSQRSTASGQDYRYDDSRRTPAGSRRNTYTGPRRRSPAPNTPQRRGQTNYDEQYY